jgi:NitT/TauT family transport system permease protein
MRPAFAKPIGWLVPFTGAAGFLAVWAGAVQFSGTRIFPSPAAVVRALFELGRRGLLIDYARDSLERVAAGFLLAVLVGIPMGALLARSARAAAVANPLLQFLRPISPIAWIPLAIVFFGISNRATIFLTFLGAFFPITVSTVGAVRGVPAIHVRAAQNFGVGRPALFFRVLLPSALPEILAGLRIALGIAWMVLVAAEMIAVDSGLGYLIIDARNAGQRYDLVVAGMLLIGVIGLLLDAGMRRLEALRAIRWGLRAR